MKQTAVDWLIEAVGYKNEEGKICINIHPDCDITPEIKKAKQMEKEQIEEAYKEGAWCKDYKGYTEEYYEETYEKK
jgi:hypothetical protein